MKNKLFIIIIIFLSTSLLAEETEKNAIRRFAVIVGANNGGASRVKLKYAVSDAEKNPERINKTAKTMI